MKELFVNKSISLIKKNYSYNDIMYERIRYGLEIIYLSITKIFVILLVSYLLGMLKETIILMIFSTPLRNYSYGIHAKKSWHCYVSSIFCFVLLPKLIINYNLSIILRITISIYALISMIIYAPADTHKRPIINTKHRKKLKCTSIIITITYIFLTILINDNYICNLIYLELLIQSTAIIPITYKIFKMPYNNYKAYQKGL